MTPPVLLQHLRQALLVAIALVYLPMVILFGSLLVPLAIFFALPLAVIDSFVAFAVTGRALNLSALADLRMPRGIVVTNAVVLLTLVQPRAAQDRDRR